ncbi:sigma-54-dependent Fis family transcriptional regulator [Hymenobacter terrenus]|uniref:sigma-54-dependent Fis family transcriptional regulator n=1 Tax=Hymenobacter terrenus TaxID=1629124 RepID=UPI0006982A0E|nr:sigma 54-interacting transcriptional regulator [Hymenobacter terrenus]
MSSKHLKNSVASSTAVLPAGADSIAPEALPLLLELSTAIASIRDRATLLRLIFQKAQPVFGFHDVGLFVLSPDGQHIADWTTVDPGINPSFGNQEFHQLPQQQFAYPDSGLAVLVDRFAHAGQPVVVPYDEAYFALINDPDFRTQCARIIAAGGYREFLGTLLRTGGRVLGYLCFNSLQSGYFQPAQFELFQAVADQVTGAVANILAREEIMAREQEKTILLSISESITSARNAVELLSIIREKAQHLIPFYNTGILIVEPDGQYHYDLAVTIPVWDDSEGNQKLYDAGLLRLTHPNSYIAYVMQLLEKRKTPVIEDYELRFGQFDHPFFPVIKEVGAKEGVVALLRSRGKTFGTFWLNALAKNHFQPKQFEIFQALADQVAVAVANILANEEILERERVKAALLGISETLAEARTRRELLQVIFDQIRAVLPFADAGLFEVRPDGAHRDLTVDNHLDGMPTGRAISQAGLYGFLPAHPAVDEFLHEPRVRSLAWLLEHYPGHPHFPYIIDAELREVLGGPLIHNGHRLGMLCLWGREEGTFHARQLPLFKQLLSLLATTMANLLANEEIIRREHEKTSLLEINELIAQVKSTDNLLRLIVTQIKPLFGFHDFSLFVVSTDGHTHTDLAAVLPEVSPSERNKHVAAVSAAVPHLGSVIEWMMEALAKTGQPVLFDFQDLAVQFPEYPQLNRDMLEMGYRDCLAANLTVRGRAIGMFCINALQKDFFQPAVIPLFQYIAHTISIAMANILANEEIMAREREKAQLLSISSAIATIRDKEDLFKVITDTIRPILGFEHAAHIFSIDPDKETIGIFLRNTTEEIANDSEYRRFAKVRFPIKGSPFEEVLATGGIFLLDPEVMAERYPTYQGFQLMNRMGLRQSIIAPLRHAGKTIGTFHLFNSQKNYFNSSHFPLLQTIADQIAVAVSNILANEDIMEREREKSLQLAISNSLITYKERDPLCVALASEINEIVPFRYFNVRMQVQNDAPYYWTSLRKQPNRSFVSISEELVEQRALFESADPVLSGLVECTAVCVGDEFVQLTQQSALAHFFAQQYEVCSQLRLALPLSNGSVAAIELLETRAYAFSDKDYGLLQLLIPQISMAFDNLFAFEQIATLKSQLEREKSYLVEEIKTTYNFEEIIGGSTTLKQVFRQVSQVAAATTTVLILGETGTGKELIARALHNQSPRKERVLIKVNCAALPTNLIESELFGHEKGSFTGAYERRIGKFELANSGTIFLDEIGELPLELQAKLLRVIQEREFERLGGKGPLKTDVRIIAATNRNLQQEVLEGRFRADLYYRLSVFPITLPPLRERQEDIPVLATYFAQKFSQKMGRPFRGIRERALLEMVDYAWPGNIRELENMLEQAVILANGNSLDWTRPLVSVASRPSALAVVADYKAPENDRERILAVLKETKGKILGENGAARLLNMRPSQLEGVERDYLLAILAQTRGRIRGVEGAAELLGMHPNTLDARLRKLGIRKEHLAG